MKLVSKKWLFIWTLSVLGSMQISNTVLAAKKPVSTTAEMYRERDGQVYATGQGIMSGYIEDFGHLTRALPASKGYYILSPESPTAGQPLVLIGTASQILTFFAHHPHSGIDNRFQELPTIYMTIAPYKPVKSRYKVTIPIFDVTRHFVERLKGALGTFRDPTPIVEVLENAASGIEFAEKYKEYITLHKKEEQVLYVKFTYLKEEPKLEKLKKEIKNFEIGRGRVTFTELLDKFHLEFVDVAKNKKQA